MTEEAQVARPTYRPGHRGNTTLRSNKNVVAIQSRLYSPGYAGPARWVLFEPSGRRAFSALGKDIVPSVIQVLAAVSPGASGDDLATSCPDVPESRLNELVTAGLLVEGDERCPVVESFTSTFHGANVDYPFFDYGSDDVMSEESDLLDRYAALWEPPTALAARRGVAYALPPATVGFCCDETPRFPTLDQLAQILHTVLAPIGEIPTRHITCLRRTTPSGGARHPTEVLWVSRRPVGNVPPGVYTYDAAEHALVLEESEDEAFYERDLGGSDFCFVVRSRVARAMWRYRDLRALRPLLIDAGHVAEMLAFLLAKQGVTSEVLSPQRMAWTDNWLEEPGIAVARPQQASGGTRQRPDAAVSVARSGSGDLPEHLRTNPAMVLRFDETMAVDILWPERTRQPIDTTDFLVLNHCLPSARGDRDCTPDGICETVPSATTPKIRSLVDAGALIAADQADMQYRDLQLWVRHEWYLSALALLESLADGRSEPAVSQITARCDYLDDEEVLLKRRTSRTFSPEPIEALTLEQLLRSSLADVPADLTVTVAAYNVTGLESAVYRSNDTELERVAGPLSRDEVAAATAGQSAASAGAATLWLSLQAEPARPATYVRDLLDLGRLGQRLCMVATDLGLDVFLTPAAYDTQTCSLLHLAHPDRLLTYLFCFGLPSEMDT